jgi:hypothetical protein
MENWRGYMQESEEAALYGDLYLSEGGEVSKTSFYDAINTLSESDEDVDRFLENWERSIDHMFARLNESIPIETGMQDVDDEIVKASAQSYVALGRLGAKAAKPVANVLNKLKAMAQKKLSPKTTALIGAVALPLAGALAHTIGQQLAGGTLDAVIADAMSNMLANIEVIANELGANVDFEKSMQDLGNNAPANRAPAEFTPPQGTEWDDVNREWIKSTTDDIKKTNDAVSQAVGDPGLEKAMSKWEDGIQDQWSDMLAQADKNRAGGAGGGSDTMSQWGDMLAQADADRAARGAGDAVRELSTAESYEEFMTILVKGETPDYRALQNLATAIEGGKFDDENRKFLKSLIKYMPPGEEKRQLRGFIRARDAGKVLQTILNVTPHGAVVNVIDKFDTAGGIIRDLPTGEPDFAGRIARGVTKLGKSLEE